MADKSEDEDLLFTVFKKLKVEADWTSSLRQTNYKCDDKVSADKSDEARDANKLKSPSKTFIQRAQPYTKDKLPAALSDLQSFDNLTLAKETCTKVTCHCNLKKRSLGSPGAASPAVSSNHLQSDGADTCKHVSQCASSDVVSPKGILHEVRLKLHNKHKDQKVVLRAARLKLASGVHTGNGAKKLFNGVCTLGASQSPPIGKLRKATVFGIDRASTSDFQTVAEESKQDFTGGAAGSPSGEDRTKYECLGAFRTPAPITNKQKEILYDFNSLKETLDNSDSSDMSNDSLRLNCQVLNQCPVHPGKCPKPCSCAHQARLDDWSEEELACYFEEFVHIPKKMSMMAEMMYT